jgi:hypothetical protein
MIQKELERITEWGKRYEEIYTENIKIGEGSQGIWQDHVSTAY